MIAANLESLPQRVSHGIANQPFFRKFLGVQSSRQEKMNKNLFVNYLQSQPFVK
jgi:hypothetical protein